MRPGGADSQEERMSTDAAQNESESTTQTPAEATENTEATEAKMFDEAYVKKLRDEAAGYRVKLKEIEDRDKTEAQKAAERLAELESEVEKYRTRDQVAKWSAEITQGSPIPPTALRGNTREELEAHFEELKALIPAKPNGPIVPGAGDTPTSKPVNDERGFLRELFGDQ